MRKMTLILYFVSHLLAGAAEASLPMGESRAHYQESWRKVRRMGVGLNFSDVYGVLGAQLELNLTNNWCAQIGYGGGGDHSAFAFQVKRVLGGVSLHPYVSTGVVHWASRSEEPVGSKTLTPSYLSSKFLSEAQKSAPSFQEVLIPLTAGLQYMQSHGPWAGTSVFVEINALTDVGDIKMAATGTLGMSYFF